MKGYNGQKGFSLAELAIVITIIGLLVGGILGGISLRRNLQIKTMMDEVSRLTQAFSQFKEIYHFAPGDMWNAVSTFGSATLNGNGNELIDTLAEQSLVFQHLALAGLISGEYTTNWATSTQSNSSIAQGKYFFWNSLVGQAALNHNFINIARIADLNNDGIISGNTEAYRSILTSEEMRSLDQKYDDSMPTTGFITATNGFDAVINSCVNLGSYVVGSNHLHCIFAIAIDKQF
ncbi:MAG: prepilin-type N-terminal cleavage/methylation domain-containing protein [Burkholderiales bacterium]